jgi:hypothetical protein
VRCTICKAWCRCKNGGRGICCSCHPHKVVNRREGLKLVRRFGAEHFYQDCLPGVEPLDSEETNGFEHLQRERGIR